MKKRMDGIIGVEKGKKGESEAVMIVSLELYPSGARAVTYCVLASCLGASLAPVALFLVLLPAAVLVKQ